MILAGHSVADGHFVNQYLSQPVIVFQEQCDGFQPSVFQPVPCVTPSIARCFRCERYEVEDDQCQEAVGRSYPQTADHVDKEHVSEYASSCLTFPCFGHQSSFCICEITRL
jgi:hypothetical protein